MEEGRKERRGEAERNRTATAEAAGEGLETSGRNAEQAAGSKERHNIGAPNVANEMVIASERVGRKTLCRGRVAPNKGKPRITKNPRVLELPGAVASLPSCCFHHSPPEPLPR